MPNWNQVLDEIQQQQLSARQQQLIADIQSRQSFDTIRRKYLSELFEYTQRNVIAYYSAWQSKRVVGTEINDEDRNGFMMALHEIDCSKGLDLILHTPGGSISATQSIVNYLQDKFEGDVRAIIPHTAMSAGTIIACSCKEILMAKHSSIGPIDPQIHGVPAHGLLAEFEQAHKEISLDPTRQFVWQPILQQYTPTLLGNCKNAIDWSEQFTRDRLANNMFLDLSEAEKQQKIASVIQRLTEYDQVKLHERQINYNEAREIGLKIGLIEDDQRLQDLVLTVHHCFMHTLSNTAAIKLIENQKGAASIKLMVNP
jgi:membrane-bound ClpP family serine protease